MTYYNRQAEAERKRRDTPEKIVQIANRKGYFEVSLRWRDDWLRARCQKLKQDGLLRGGQRKRDRLVFYPVKNDDTISTGPHPVGS